MKWIRTINFIINGIKRNVQANGGASSACPEEEANSLAKGVVDRTSCIWHACSIFFFLSLHILLLIYTFCIDSNPYSFFHCFFQTSFIIIMHNPQTKVEKITIAEWHFAVNLTPLSYFSHLTSQLTWPVHFKMSL